MKINWGIIKFVIILGFVIGLFSFTGKRNQGRNLSKLKVEFVDERPPFITLNAVNKLLIVNHDSVKNIAKEHLVLMEMESRLLANTMIRDAQVFVTVDGVLGAKIEQREPLARVAAQTHYYIDADGKKMPLSNVYTARVPLITGNVEQLYDELTQFLKKINKDSFMKSSVIGLHVKNKNNIEVQLRNNDFKVLFGNTNNAEKKFMNLKAFYQKAKRDDLLSVYKAVDLRYGSQVVATKK